MTVLTIPSNTLARTAVAAGCVALFAACTSADAPPEPLPEASAVSLEGLDEGVSGRVAGEPFEARDQRFVVVSREGRERVDLRFSDRPIERCGLPIARDDRRVWIRFAGRTALEPGTYERIGDEGDFEVHYELPAERGVRSVHRGVGRIEVRHVGPRAVEGLVNVCFADEERSCVAGTFRATACLSRVDGRALRESPGLVDEVLERAGGAPP